MEYKKTSVNPKQVVYLGIKIDVREGRVHTTVFDREEQYPMHIVRYPHWDTVAPRQQFGGVLMGRFIACQEACTHVQDFKESVGNVVRRSIGRHFPFNLVMSVWKRFLHQHWKASDIRVKELLLWMKKVWRHFNNRSARMPNPHNPQQSVRPTALDSEFLQVFGCPVTAVMPAEEGLPSQDAPSGEHVIDQGEVQAVADAAPAVVEPQQEAADNMDIGEEADMQVVAVQSPPPPAVPPHCIDREGSQPCQQVNILNMVNVQPVQNLLVGAVTILHPTQMVVRNNVMQLVAYSQSDGNHDEELHEAADDILVDDGEGQGEAEMPVDTDAYVQGHERILPVWHPDSPVGQGEAPEGGSSSRCSQASSSSTVADLLLLQGSDACKTWHGRTNDAVSEEASDSPAGNGGGSVWGLI